jgi:GGDEF domain-containing protein
MLIGEVLDQFGGASDFLGHAGGDNFIVITSEASANGIRQKLKERFAEEVKSHYNFMDRQQGYILAPTKDGGNDQFPLMTMAIGMVAPSQQSFADIREITELAADARRQDSSSSKV